MLRYSNCPPEGKPDYENVNDADWVVRSVAARFGLKLHVARLVARLAGLGGDGSAAA
jgi:hypothetical protein